MNSLKLFPFMNKGRLTGTDDLNNVLTSGIYEISAPTTGVLNGKDIQYGILIVFSAGQRIQLLGNGLYGNAYFRTGRDNGRWYDWVSIYWHKIYSKRELGELIGVNYLKKAFDYKNIILGSNESYELGICAGLVVIRNIYISAAFSLLLIDEFHNAVTTIAGNSIKELGLEFRFDTTDYKARMSIINVSSNNANIEISYQNLSF